MGLLQKVVKNDAMRTDPPEIYGWRVFALACSGKAPIPPLTVSSDWSNNLRYSLLWCYDFRMGYWRNWRNLGASCFQEVCFSK